MIIYFKQTAAKRKLRKLKKFESGCWIHVVNPSAEELDLLVTQFSLDEDFLEDGLDENELPRIDTHEGKTYIFKKIVSKDSTSLGTLLIVLGETFVLTLAKEEPLFLMRLAENKEQINTAQRLKFIVALLTALNEEFEKTVMRIVKSVKTRRKTAHDLKDSDMNLLLTQEDFLNSLVSTYYYSNLLYAKMIKKINFYEEDRDILEDLMVETTEGLNLCRNSLKTISNIRNYYSVILSNKLNRTIKFLTLFTIFINLPAAISGIYGMNVALPWQQQQFTFYYIITTIVLIWGGFFFYLKKKDLL